jgi:hypothetical protein
MRDYYINFKTGLQQQTQVRSPTRGREGHGPQRVADDHDEAGTYLIKLFVTVVKAFGLVKLVRLPER